MKHQADLDDDTARLLGASIDQKVAWVQADSWVHTAQTTAAMQWMEYLFRSERSIRPTCMQIIADGGMGKTALLGAFEAMHPVQKSDDPLRLCRPVIFAEGTAESHGTYGVRAAILTAAWPEAKHFSYAEREIDLTLRAQGVRVVLFDELGEVIKGGKTAHVKALSELKRISNRSQVNLVVATVENLAHVLDIDNQFAKRFLKKIRIPAWALSEELRSFVYGLERRLPFPERSFLDGKELLPWLARYCEGNTKLIVETVRYAAQHALGRGGSCLLLEDLENAKDNPLPPGVGLRKAA